MNNRKIIKGYKTLISSRFNVDTSVDKFKDGIIYTLYSDEFNSLKVGFAENDKVLEKKLSSEALILLDMKKGKKKDLCLLITTLKELGISSSSTFTKFPNNIFWQKNICEVCALYFYIFKLGTISKRILQVSI